MHKIPYRIETIGKKPLKIFFFSLLLLLNSYRKNIMKKPIIVNVEFFTRYASRCVICKRGRLRTRLLKNIKGWIREMKKFFVSVVALSAVLTVAACSSETSKPKTETTAPQTETANKDANKPADKPATESTNSQQGETKANDKLESKKVLSDKVEILLPKGFEEMSEEMAKVKYPMENRPKLIYTNKDGSVNVAFNQTATPIKDSQMSEFKDQMKKAFDGMYAGATWYKDEVVQINGKNVGVFELLTPGVDTKIYNLMFFVEVDGKMLMTTFNCPEGQMNEWKPLAQEILQSLKVN